MAGNGFLLLPTLFPYLFRYDRCYQHQEPGMSAAVNEEDEELKVDGQVEKVM
jgi:hypothetical protein